MAQLRTPILCIVIGEGCSGGALAIGVGDKTLMLQYSYYSVISPEGCASILWKSADFSREAAEALNLTADRLHSLGLIDEVIEEPLGGAHRNLEKMAKAIKGRMKASLAELTALPVDQLLSQRYDHWLQLGKH